MFSQQTSRQENLFPVNSERIDTLTIVYILVAILIFGVIIMIHELGHFAVAKAMGIRVNEFSIGMGPKIVSWGKKETSYSLRCLPIGGFVAMEGEDESSEDPRAFRNRPVWRRLLVVLAGPIMNLVLGFLILVIVTACSDAIVSTTVAQFYTEDTSSHVTGLEVGDKIVEVNGRKIFTDTDISYEFQIDEDAVFDMVVVRDGEKVSLSGVTFESAVSEDGSSTLYIDFMVVGEKVTPISVVSYSARKTVSVSRMIWLSFADLLKGKYSINDLSGPVGIVDAIGEVVSTTSQGVAFTEMLETLMTFVVYITINVGIFNLLPIPALDGSRAVFLIIEGIRRKPVKPEHEGMVHFIGMAAMLLLMLVVTVNDVIKLF